MCDYAQLKQLETSDKRFSALRFALTGRLHVAYQQSFGRWTRALFQDKARSVTAGMNLRDAYGPAVLAAVVDDFFDREIPHFDKNEDERPPRKRKRQGDDDRTDPLTITDHELAHELLQCRKCYKALTTRDSCYSRARFPDDVVCLPCWQEDDRETHCDRCRSTERVTHAGRVYRCRACLDADEPPRVVRLRRTKTGLVVQGADVYIGRRCTQGGWMLDESKWANPHVLPPKATEAQRADVLQRYEAYVRGRAHLLLDRIVPELSGKTLGCWCHPKACHGDVLVKLWHEMKEKKGVA
jgi:hypothetical protein